MSGLPVRNVPRCPRTDEDPGQPGGPPVAPTRADRVEIHASDGELLQSVVLRLDTRTVNGVIVDAMSIDMMAALDRIDTLSREDTMQSTSIENGLPEGLARVATVPNPTSGPTEFSFRVPTAGYVSIDVFDFRGRRVARVYEGSSYRSEGVVAWNGRDDAGREIASGVYLVKMRAGEWLTTQKLTVVR